MRTRRIKVVNRIVAGALALILGVSFSGFSSIDTIVNEQHDLPIAMADGKFGGKGSNLPIGGPGEYEEETSMHLFNILEILPTEKKATVGFTIGGCEPFNVANVDDIKRDYGVTVTTADLKQAYMDALVNPSPGAYSEHDNADNILGNNTMAKYLKDINGKFSEQSGGYAFDFKLDTYTGYYKYVGDNNGVYAVDKNTGKVYSKFYSTSDKKYDYIFVYDLASSGDDDFTPKNGAERRVRYTNKEKFITEWLGESVDIKKNTKFEVTTRTPRSVSTDDIERADLILMNDAYKGDYYKFALELQNDMRDPSRKNTDKDLGVHFYSPANDGNVAQDKRMDFDDFEKVIKIYERVVVRGDAAFVAEKTCCTDYNGGEITKVNTNIRKLMFMLFYVKQGNTRMAGRELFSDFFKRYTSEPGQTFGKDPEDPKKTITYLEMRKRHLENPSDYPVDYRAASLKRNTSDPSQPNYYYMHMHASYHVGHPLVIDKDSCITGAKTESYTFYTSDGSKTITLPVLDSDGSIVPLHDIDIINQRSLKIETTNPEMFTDAEFGYQDNPVTVDQKKYYTDNGISYYQNCYESMSNTTDYIYIDKDGKLKVSTKYSSDQLYNPYDYWKYWYKIDADFHEVGGSTFRRRKWGPAEYDEWPWDSTGEYKEGDKQPKGLLTVWLMHRTSEGDIYDCNMHMWYDYFEQAAAAGMQKYTTSQQAPFGETYKNQSLMGENGFYKDSWIKNALTGRDIKREKTDKNHIASDEKNVTKKAYYLSMNIINGDSVTSELIDTTDSTNKNKTIYLNKYEIEKMNDTSKPLPLDIEIVTSHKISNISLIWKNNKTSEKTTVKTYSNSSGVGEGGGSLGDLELTEDKTDYVDGNAPFDTANNYYKYKLTGTVKIPKDCYKSGANNTVIVEATNEVGKSQVDMITIVTRDFFGLN